ncbi:MAG: RidA family protein [Cytophagales bacterium]|nr:RidA family protein [Cytophagales bacterium]
MEVKEKEAKGLGMPWEAEYGYAQAVRVGNMVWLSGQLGHDDKGVLAEGMEAQMRQTYANIRRLLEAYGLTMDDVTEEVLYVLDTQAAFLARKKLGREVYADPMQVASTLIGVVGLALPGQLVEIKIVARK